MNKMITKTSRISLAYVVSAALMVLATGFTVSALLAQPPSGTPKKTGDCTDWPLKQDQLKVEQAFDKVLTDSATDTSLRKELLDTSNCYKHPKAAVQKTLDAMPGNKVEIPKEVVIIFYENDTPELKMHQTPRDPDYPSDHCLHIFFLPSGAQTTTKTSFRDNLMCCYKPWAPQR
jgi:hypothetical protein